MARKKTRGPELPQRAELLRSREEVAQALTGRVTIGRELRARKVRSADEIRTFGSEVQKWNDFNGELLSRLFTTDEYHKEYYPGVGFISMYERSPQQILSEMFEDLDSKCERLESIVERLPLISESSSVALGPKALQASASLSTDVFLVHGHDEAAKQEVARFIEKLGLRVTILAEQPNRGRTIIEKFEEHAAPVAFAVVLLTPDDRGHVASANELQPRARQNVVLELGYFFGKLGRSRVCALHKPGVELPSDIHGVLYVEMTGDWKLKLAREMRAAGLPVDMNSAL